MAIIVKCNQCGNDVKKSPCHVRPGKNYFCNPKCHATFQKGKNTGESNPNYGNKWTEEKKESFSNLIKSKVNDEYRLNCSKGMKGKTVSEETKKQRKATIIKKYGQWPKPNHTEETRELIGKKSKEKFTQEYRNKMYETMVNRGYWIKKEDLDDYKHYYRLAEWDKTILSHSPLGMQLLNDTGMYNSFGNTKGVVRDHRYSRKSGFLNNVYPEILKHPCNCELILHVDNIRKHHSNKVNSNSLSLNELFDLIENYSGNYEYNTKCLELINLYKQGGRYSKENYL
jgi:hypothetical protein